MSSYIYLALLVVIVAAEFIRPPALYYRGLYHDLDEDKDGIVSMTELGYLRDCLRLVISERKFDRTAFFVIDPIAYEKAPDDAVLDEHGSITREQLRRLLELLMPQIFTPHNFLRDSAWDEKGTRAKAINHEPGYTKERQFNLTSEEARALNAETDLRNDLLSMVDFDENGYVSFYEFARYLRSLAPIHDHAYVLGRYMEHQSNGLMNEREMVICLRRLLGQCTNIFQSPSACHVLDATLNMVDEDENIPPQELINKMLDLHFAKYTGPNEDSVYEKEMESGKKHPHAHNH